MKPEIINTAFLGSRESPRVLLPRLPRLSSLIRGSLREQAKSLLGPLTGLTGRCSDCSAVRLSSLTEGHTAQGPLQLNKCPRFIPLLLGSHASLLFQCPSDPSTFTQVSRSFKARPPFSLPRLLPTLPNRGSSPACMRLFTRFCRSSLWGMQGGGQAGSRCLWLRPQRVREMTGRCFI